MTDLNKILSRQDYIKMTKSLREKCDTLEEIISSKMVDLEICDKNNSIIVNGMRIFCISEHLFIRTPEYEDSHCSEYRSVNSSADDGVSYVYYEDSLCFVRTPCSNRRALAFLNNAVAIIEKLGEIEQKKVELIEQAIDATKNL